MQSKIISQSGWKGFVSKHKLLCLCQRRNRWGVGEAERPLTFFTGKIFLIYLENKDKEKRENGEEKKENCEREGGKWKIEGKKYENDQRTFLYTFWNHWNLFRVYQNGKFLPGKSIFHTRKKSGIVTLPPLKDIPLTPLVCVFSILFITK